MVGDGDLVRKIASGARDAEGELCRRFAPRARLYGLRHLRSEDAAADLAQIALLAVLEAARAGRIEDPDRIDRFVLGVCRNTALKMREQRSRAELSAEIDVGITMPSFEKIDAMALADCFHKLDVRSRDVLVLSFHAQNAADEIAVALATTAGNVRVLRHRALAQLRGCLDGAP